MIAISELRGLRKFVESCPKCGMKKRQAGPGSITQWIATCQCDELVAQPDDGAQPIQLCKTCNKRLAAGRVGSLTQWVFRSDICDCQTPRPTDSGSALSSRSATVSAVRAPFSDDDLNSPALELDEETFPADRYRPLSEIGRGASGVVYLALDLMLHKKVAIKSLKSLTWDQLMSFQKEAQATSKLNHEQIIKIFDFGAAKSGAPYMVMEYFDGLSLKHLIDTEGPLSEQDAVPIFLGLSRALAHAHLRGIFHRDVKSSNVLLRETKSPAGKSKTCDVRVIDFGVAAFKESSQEGKLAQGVTLVGTPPYMAPDQLRGKTFDARSEVYSLGCLFVETLCGRPPFIADTALETLNMHATKPAPSLIELYEDGEFSDELESIVARCLAKNPDDRFQSMNDLTASLESLVNLTHSHYSEGESDSDTAGNGARAVQEGSGRLPVKPLLVLVPVVLIALVVSYTLRFRDAKVPSTEKHPVDKLDSPDLTLELPGVVASERVSSSSPSLMTVSNGSDKSLNALSGKGKIRELLLINGHFSAAGLARLIPLSLDKLTLKGVAIDPQGVDCLGRIHSLKSLVLERMAFSDDSFAHFQGRALQSFTVSDSNFKDSFLASFSRQKQLRTLALTACPDFTGEGLARLTNSELETLHLHQLQDLKDNSFFTIAELKHLTALSLIDTAFLQKGSRDDSTSVIGMKTIRAEPYDLAAFEALTKLRLLKSLSLDCDRMTEQHFNILSRMNRLEVLALSGRELIKPKCVDEIVKLNNLQTLKVGGPCLERVGLDRLVAIPNLARLVLCDSDLTNTDLNVLPKSRITSFALLGENSVSDAGLIHLSRMPNLVLLQLSRVSFITPGGIAEFSRQNPRCRVQYLGP
jgi:serine/threonine protein kinase